MKSTTIKKKTHVVEDVPLMFDAVFECTLNMINKDFEQFPEHRTNFFTLLQAVNQHCFPALIALAAPQFKLVLDSVIWAFKHTMRNVADIGLDILHGIMINIKNHQEAAQSFYQNYYIMILQHIFSVVTDTSHTAALTKHATILSLMFATVENNNVTVLLYDPAQVQNPNMNNELYIKEYTAALLKQAFPHLQHFTKMMTSSEVDDVSRLLEPQNLPYSPQIKVFVQGLFDLDENLGQFKDHLRDFLVQIKEYQGENCEDLYLEEREQQLRLAQEEKRKRQKAVPGILNPHEIGDEMQDD